MTSAYIISKLPYAPPFLFVDEILEINAQGVTGLYKFPEDSFFYSGHFKDNPVTPGVLLIECMAQIGVVSLGVFLISSENYENVESDRKIGLSSTEIDFFKPVFPGESVKVVSTKEYFRFNKLKCKVEMFDTEENLICRGKIAGMISREPAL
ncbi:3-hydroxyacyl-ACP dehydratase FabZ family protein [Gillisia limnaea]|uniref:Beta-hydroxyacyl-(Acyl-carrier-protein) dehydratase FabA/FabZ n=1 Tax=Gillisia limnaea (strain DSM 15749 / LMG 21470 / R-8282) TaxID=865937 RepID=H2BQP9_GILLR|nr:FabA/FabZ family ACP-dehydratase [Gillisia limnaea]EHQ04218.1 Beta-hydroxyacyl-(acyl-carrier-protein) dehydratase FabA/FabZ [Gillisia limnaea DSM 15749]